MLGSLFKSLRATSTRAKIICPLLILFLTLLVTGCVPGPAPTASPAPQSVVSTLAGSGRHGPLGGGYADGPAMDAIFHEPIGLAVDSAGNIYVSEWKNHRIRVITPDGQVRTLAGGGQTGPYGSFAEGRGEAARFYGPEGLTVDAESNVYVADSHNQRIRRVAPDGTVTTVAGGGFSGLLGAYVDGPADEARFAQPLDVAVDAAGNLYVADFLNHAIRKISVDGQVTTLAGNGLPGGEDGAGQAASFELPNRITIDQAGNLYVTEGRARDFDERTEAQFDIPQGVAVDDAGNVYVSDTGNSCIRRIGSDGMVTTVAGTGDEEYIDGPADDAAFWYPMDVAVTPAGDLLVADWQNHRIRGIWDTSR